MAGFADEMRSVLSTDEDAEKAADYGAWQKKKYGHSGAYYAPGSTIDYKDRERFAAESKPATPAAPQPLTPFTGPHVDMGTDETAERARGIYDALQKQAPGPFASDEQKGAFDYPAHYAAKDTAQAEARSPEFAADVERIGNEEVGKAVDQNLRGLGMFAATAGAALGLGGAMAAGRSLPFLAGEVAAEAAGLPINPVDAVGVVRGLTKSAPGAATEGAAKRAGSFADEMAAEVRAMAPEPKPAPAPKSTDDLLSEYNTISTQRQRLERQSEAFGLTREKKKELDAAWDEAYAAENRLYDELQARGIENPEEVVPENKYDRAERQNQERLNSKDHVEFQAEYYTEKARTEPNPEYRAIYEMKAQDAKTRLGGQGDVSAPLSDDIAAEVVSARTIEPEAPKQLSGPKAEDGNPFAVRPDAAPLPTPFDLPKPPEVAPKPVVPKPAVSTRGVGGSERGSAFLPSSSDIRDAVGRAGFIDNRKLEKFELEPGVNVAHREAIRRQATTGAADTAQEVTADVYRGVTPHEFDAGLDEYPILRRELELLKDGMPIEDNRQALDVITRMAEIESKIDPARLRDFLARYDAVSDEMFDRMRKQGIIPATAKKDNYARRIVIPHYEDSGLGPTFGGGRREIAPGSTKKTKGSTSAVERSASRALAYHVNEVLTSEASHEFFRDITTKFSKNADIRTSGRAIPKTDGLALYKVKGFGQPGEILKDRKVADAVQEALSRESVNPKTGQRWLTLSKIDETTGQKTYFKKQLSDDDPIMIQDGHNGDGSPRIVEYHLFPKELAEGLVDAATKPKFPGALKGIGALNSAVKSLYLQPNIGYHVIQQVQDAAAALGNVPITQARMLANKAAMYAEQLVTDYVQVAKGHRSPRLEKLRQEGMMGGTFASFIDEAVDDAGHIIPEERIPFRFRSGKTQAKGAIKAALMAEPLKVVAQIREASYKLAIRDLVENAGGTARRGTVYAQESLGNYWRTSDVGKYLGPLTQFTKWFLTAAHRVSVGMAKDPLTGITANPIKDPKSFMRGLWWGPMPKIAIKAGVVTALNAAVYSYWREQGIEPRPNDRVGGTFGEGILTPYKDKHGKPIWVDVDGYSDMLDAVIEPIADFVKAGFGVAARGIGRKAASRAATVARVPVELAINEKLGSGAPIETDRAAAMGTDAQAKLNPFGVGDKAQYAIEQFGGYPARVAAKIMDPKGTGMDVARTAFGFPAFGVDPREASEQEVRKYGEAYYDQFANLLRKKDRSESEQKAYDGLKAWAFKNGAMGGWIEKVGRGFTEEMTREALTRDQRKEKRLVKYPMPRVPEQ